MNNIPKKMIAHILSANVTLAGLEQLSENVMYKQELKQIGNRFIQVLSKYVEKPTSKIWGSGEAKDASMYTLMDYQHKLYEKLSSMTPEQIGVVLAMVEKYEETPAKVLKRLEIKMVDAEEAY